MSFFSNYIFPNVYDIIVKNKELNKKREEVLKKAHGHVLEIGVGTGLNLSFYPKNVNQLTAIDPNPGMKKQFLKKSSRWDRKTQFYLSGAEKMPFSENSFDTVVSTLVLCSLPQLEDSLKEIHRVLKPEGQFLFFDHGQSPDKKIKKLQNLINPFHKRVADGCQLNLPISKILKASEFKELSISEGYLPSVPRIYGYFYSGVAKKG